MFGSLALDVVIGIVFIYLLYSLYATISMEIIASLIGLRSKNLRFALKRMLKDEIKYDDRFQKALSSIGTTFLRFFGKAFNLKNPELYERFKDQSTIKYLGSGGFGGRPSYLSAENFTKALIDSIKIDDPDISLMAAIEIGLQSFPDDSDTRIQIQRLMDDAHNDQLKFKVLLDKWFNDTMERCAGWYKQSTQIVIIIIGFFLVYNFNLDSIEIIKSLSKDKVAREQMVKLATEFSQNNANAILDTKADTSAVQDRINARLDSLAEVKNMLRKDMQNAQMILSNGWNIPEKLQYRDTLPDSVNSDSIRIPLDTGRGGIVLHKSVDSTIVLKLLRGKGKAGLCKYGQISYKMSYIFLRGHFLGYLLTMLALSLGAPFWFDLLNKLVKLRTSIPATDKAVSFEKRNEGTVSNNPTNRVA